MACFVPLFGEKLKGKDGEVDTATALDGKTAVGIYFSAHWCPPCRGFTPQLAQAYSETLKGKGLEVVFVSSDRDADGFNGYYGEMPWLALPYENRDAKTVLSKKFKVRGIPSFVILDGSTGEVITTSGRSKVSEDPSGDDFPWRPKPLIELLPDQFLKGDDIVGKDALAGKHIGIYFSAHWCPPCRGFTPKLAAHYKAYKEKGLPFEIIFSTGDRDEESFKSYFKEMKEAGGDWLAIPWDQKRSRDALDSLFDVQGIPALVIVDSDGKVVNANARGAVSGDSTGDGFPWAPPLIKPAEAPEGIDDQPSIVVFVDGAPPDEQASVITEMQKVAKVKPPDAYNFYVAKSNDGAVSQIRMLTKLKPPSSATMILLDLDDDGAFYLADSKGVNEATITDFIAKYESKSLERKQCEKN